MRKRTMTMYYTDTLYFELNDEFEIIHNVSEGSLAIKMPNGVYDDGHIREDKCSESIDGLRLTLNIYTNERGYDNTFIIQGYQKLTKTNENRDEITVYRSPKVTPTATPAIAQYMGDVGLIDDLREWFGLKHLIAIGYLEDFYGTKPYAVTCDGELCLGLVYNKLDQFIGTSGNYTKPDRVSILSFFYVAVLMSRGVLIPEFFLNKHCNLIEENKVKFNSLCKKYNETVLKQSSYIRQYEVACLPDHLYY